MAFPSSRSRHVVWNGVRAVTEAPRSAYLRADRRLPRADLLPTRRSLQSGAALRRTRSVPDGPLERVAELSRLVHRSTSTSPEFASVSWPQCDGLIWPHLPSDRGLRVRVLSSADRRSQKGCREWSCSRRSGGIASSTGCRRTRWRAGTGCIGGRSARRSSRRSRRSASGRRVGPRRRWARGGSGSIRF